MLLSPEGFSPRETWNEGFTERKKVIFARRIHYFILFLKHWLRTLDMEFHEVFVWHWMFEKIITSWRFRFTHFPICNYQFFRKERNSAFISVENMILKTEISKNLPLWFEILISFFYERETKWKTIYIIYFVSRS